MSEWTLRQRWAVKLNAAHVPPREAWVLLQTPGPEGLERASAADWSAACGLDPEAATRKREASLAFDADAEQRRAEHLGARLLPRGDAEYPDLLASIHDPPLLLYLRGRLAEGPPVGFVGSRGPTAYGLRQVRRLAGEAAAAGVIVVSGLARGIDGEAHRAALDAGGVTWAVLGTGLGRVYPREHHSLAERIVAGGGALLSEMPLDTAPSPELFPRRNRVVAGLCWAVLVVEGRERSGALITARLALDHGRELLAVPGPADSPLSAAPHRLLAQGAALATGLDSLLAALPPCARGGLSPSRAKPGPWPAPGPARPAADPTACGGGTSSPMARSAAPGFPSREEAQILAHLGADALSLDELVRLTGLDTNRISSIMFGLEERELICSVPGQRYAQKAV